MKHDTYEMMGKQHQKKTGEEKKNKKSKIVVAKTDQKNNRDHEQHTHKQIHTQLKTRRKWLPDAACAGFAAAEKETKRIHKLTHTCCSCECVREQMKICRRRGMTSPAASLSLLPLLLLLLMLHAPSPIINSSSSAWPNASPPPSTFFFAAPPPPIASLLLFFASASRSCT